MFDCRAGAIIFALWKLLQLRNVTVIPKVDTLVREHYLSMFTKQFYFCKDEFQICPESCKGFKKSRFYCRYTILTHIRLFIVVIAAIRCSLVNDYLSCYREISEEVTERWQRLVTCAEERHKLVTASLNFYKTAEQVCSVLDSLEREYRRDEDWCGSAAAPPADDQALQLNIDKAAQVPHCPLSLIQLSSIIPNYPSAAICISEELPTPLYRLCYNRHNCRAVHPSQEPIYRFSKILIVDFKFTFLTLHLLTRDFKMFELLIYIALHIYRLAALIILYLQIRHPVNRRRHNDR